MLVSLSVALYSSCIKDEPLNAECDIEEAYVHLNSPSDVFFSNTDTLIEVPYTSLAITFNVRAKANITALAPMFRTTPGAIVEPASGSVHDFSTGPVTYKVTSEDGKWSKTYSVSMKKVTKTVGDTLHYDFERYHLDDAGKYYVWNDVDEDGTIVNDWSSGNPGFGLSMSSAKADEYPTYVLKEGCDGAALALTTRSTGPFGAMVNKRLAAGNLFIGTFDLTSALSDAMKSTKFGMTFDKKPLHLIGYYQYTPGDKYQDEKGNIIAGKTDSAAIYSVLYRNHDDAGNAVVLYGDNVQTSSQIVAIAKIGYLKPVGNWTEFNADYNFLGDIDETLLNQHGYSFTLVFSSSKDGDKFCGSIGSTLLIDNVKVICAKTEE
jgi:hypothetical protein